MLYRISHRTTYKYGSPVSVGNHVACLKPRSYQQNQLIQNTLRISPQPVTLTERSDYFGNVLWFFTVQEPHQQLVVESLSEVLRSGGEKPDPQASLPWEESTMPLSQDHTPEGLDAYQYQFESPRIRIQPNFAAYALESFTPRRPMLEALLDLTARIHKDFRFDSRVTTVRTTTEEVFKKRGGVCQDFAHVQIACLRSIRVAARYVSGYLRTYPPSGQAASDRVRRVARVGLRLQPRLWLARHGSDEQCRPDQRAHHGGMGPRLWRCQPPARAHPGRRRTQPQRRSGYGAH